MSSTKPRADEAQSATTDDAAVPEATLAPYVEEQDWLDRAWGYVRARPWVGLIAGAVVVALLVVVLHGFDASQPIGTDPTVAGRPLSNPDQHVHTMAIDPMHPGIIYLGSHYGLFTSTNDGKAWPQKRGALNTLMITSIAPSPLAQNAVGVVGIAPSGGNFGQNGIYVTQDGGQHWYRATDPPNIPTDTQRYLIAAGASIHQWYAIYTGVGLFRSDDDGHTWKLLRAPVSNQEAQRVFWLNPAHPNEMLLGSNLGLQRSQDGGATWANVGSVSGGVFSISASPADATTVYLAGDNGVYRSTDSGQSFALASGVVSSAPFARLALSHQHANILYGLAGSEVWQSVDGGATWQQRITLQTSSPSALFVAPDNDQHLSVSFYSPPIVVASLDGGKTWRQIAS